MPGRSYELHGVRVFACAVEGVELRNDRDAIELISEAWKHRASFLVIPTARLGDDFFRLRTRIAGEIIQKFAQYRLRVAILGDIAPHVNESPTFRDFVYEANRGDQVWFVANPEELSKRLERRQSPS
jgi:Domain of unknown function (DUF4180)